MGTTYEVWVYVPDGDGYRWEQIYEGFWLVAALIHWFKGRKRGGCVRLEWRG